MNEQNLIPFNRRTESERREIAVKGGKASGLSRSFRSATKKRLKEHPELFDEIISMLERMSFEGNLKALDLLLELSVSTLAGTVRRTQGYAPDFPEA